MPPALYTANVFNVLLLLLKKILKVRIFVNMDSDLQNGSQYLSQSFDF